MQMQTYYYNGYSFFTCYSHKTGERIVQVYKEQDDGSEILIDTLERTTSKRIAMMSDEEIDNLISKYEKR